MPETRRMCVVVADTARARLFTFRAPDHEPWRGDILVEAEDLVNPSRRRRDSEMFTDPRPGLRQAYRGGPRHGVDDHRRDHRDDDERSFAADIVDHAAGLCEKMGRCPVVIVASPGMLGRLREALDRAPDWLRDTAGLQFGRDLTHLGAPKVHDWLAGEKVLPPRPRLGLQP